MALGDKIHKSMVNLISCISDKYRKLFKRNTWKPSPHKVGETPAQAEAYNRREAARALKIIMSIPVDSPLYPEDPEALLEQIWQEREENARKAAWKNAGLRCKNSLKTLRQYAAEKNMPRVRNAIAFIWKDFR